MLSRYVTVLALVPAVFSFIGACIIGVIVPNAGLVRAPFFNGLFGAVLGYVQSCAIVLILGILINLLAPLFGGRRDFDSAFKLAVYSFTPVWLAGIFLVLPGLRFLTLTGFYGAYILMARPAAPDQIARAKISRLCRIDCRLRFRARLFRRHGATHGVRHAGFVTFTLAFPGCGAARSGAPMIRDRCGC